MMEDGAMETASNLSKLFAWMDDRAETKKDGKEANVV